MEYGSHTSVALTQAHLLPSISLLLTSPPRRPHTDVVPTVYQASATGPYHHRTAEPLIYTFLPIRDPVARPRKHFSRHAMRSPGRTNTSNTLPRTHTSDQIGSERTFLLREG